jgi:tight adherence protein C
MSALVGLCAAGAVLSVGVAMRPKPAGRVLITHHPHRGRQGLRSRRTAALVAVAVVAAVVAGPIIAAIGVVVVLSARRWHAVRSVLRRRHRIEAAYPDALDLIVLAVRSGFLPAAALDATIPHVPAELGAAFSAVSARVAGGERFGDALGALDALGPVARPMIDTFTAADRYGLALAPVLERLAFDARQQRRRAADALARQLPVRLSLPLVLCTLPSFVLLAIVPLLLGAFSSLRAQ